MRRASTSPEIKHDDENIPALTTVSLTFRRDVDRAFLRSIVPYHNNLRVFFEDQSMI